MAQVAAALPGDTPPLPTISSLGPALPMGVEGQDGQLHKDIACRPWRMKEERELGALRDSHKDATVFQYVGMVLSTMLTRLGPHDLDQEGLKFEQKRLMVGQMVMGDVFYAYVWLRIQAMGPQLQLRITCPRCSKKIENWTADLNSVEVKTVAKADDAYWEYQLKQPFQARGQRVKQLVVGPPRWNSLEMLQGAGGLGTAKPAVIRASIIGLGSKETLGTPENPRLVITDTELDEMSKRDIESLTKQINDNMVGPDMTVEGACAHCRTDMKLPIDWGYDSFFGDSSQ